MTTGSADPLKGKRRRLLIVARAAIASDELLTTLEGRSRHEQLELVVLMPLSSHRAEPAPWVTSGDVAQRRMREALARFRAAGLYVHDASFCRGDPVEAVAGVVASEDVDEVVLATPRRRVGSRAASALADRLHEVTGRPVADVRGTPPPRRRHAGWSGRWVAARALLAVGLVLLGLAAASAILDEGSRSSDAPAPVR